MSPVKSQGSCGSCWCFGTMASPESNLLVTGRWRGPGTMPDLSENHLNWWHGFDPIPACQGGDYKMSAAYLTRGSGPVLEVDDPYPTNGTPAGDEDQPVHYTVREIEWYRMGEGTLDGIDAIKNALKTHGAVSTSVCWSGTFFSNDNFYQPPTTSYEPNHSVTIAGWDDNRVTQAPLPGAWLCKNSWGSTWSGDGYFWVSYYDKHAGRNPDMGAVSFHDVVPWTYDAIYEHDNHGWCGEVDAGYALNRYTAGAWGVLKATSFYTTQDNVSYDLRIYGGFSADNRPTNLLSQATGTIAHTGYHTVDLDTLVELDAGDNFCVYVSLSGGEHAIECTVQKSVLLGDDIGASAYTVESVSHPGESWWSADGASWGDLYEMDDSANFLLKAFAVVLTPGDATGDNVVDGADLAVWQQHYEPLESDNAGFLDGDFNRDARINGGDLALWQQNYGPLGAGSGLDAQIVPEPSLMMLLGTSSLILMAGFRKRRRGR
jgi:C1A family cysteine protease